MVRMHPDKYVVRRAFQRFIELAIVRPAGAYSTDCARVSTFHTRFGECIAHGAGHIADSYRHRMAFLVRIIRTVRNLTS